MENLVIVTDTVETKLESWQMFMRYISPEWTVIRVWRAVDVLIGDYSPAFKLHFYMISLVRILSILNCIYGFGPMLLSGDRSRRKALILQSVSAAAASCVTLLMCVGEMILLSGHVYRFGTDFLFLPLSPLALAPIDRIVILSAGGITAGVLAAISRRSQT